MNAHQVIADVLIPKFKAITGKEPKFETALIGPAAEMDSVQLVTFLLEAEETVNQRHGLNIRIVSDQALSERNSPFQTIATLGDYIVRLASAS